MPRSLDFNFSEAHGLCGTWASDYAALHSRIRARALKAYLTQQHAEKSRGNEDLESFGTPLLKRYGIEQQPAELMTDGRLDPPVRFLTFEWLDGCGGFADVLAGLVTALVVAILDNRALIVRNHCLPKAFEPSIINWEPDPFVPLEPARNLTLVDYGWGRTIPERARDGEVVLVWLRDKFVRIEPFFKELEGAVNVRMTSNRGVLTWLQTRAKGEWAERFKAMGMRLPYALGCSLRFLMRGASAVPQHRAAPAEEVVGGEGRGDFPKPEVQALFHSIERRLRRRSWAGKAGAGRPRVATVGIHIRVRDRVVWAGDRGEPKELSAKQVDVLIAGARKWIMCAQRVESYWFPSSVAVRWMLITNSAQLKAALKSRFPYKVLSLPTSYLGMRIV
ncbi:unnamed protein product [Closterium sp. NIES-65]|nr:unnamed protein product [Closterium sp. NIES-65]CAI5991890.1 unnamed protein product [Closterium sp. NIES-65]